MAYYNNYLAWQNPWMYYPSATPTTTAGSTTGQGVVYNYPYPQPLANQAFNWVKNAQDVENWPVAPNSVVALWNENEPVVYMKKADATGKSEIKAFDLVERVPENEKTEAPAPEYVTKDDLVSLVASVTSIRSDIETMKSDMYGIAGKRKSTRKAEVEDDA